MRQETCQVRVPRPLVDVCVSAFGGGAVSASAAVSVALASLLGLDDPEHLSSEQLALLSEYRGPTAGRPIDAAQVAEQVERLTAQVADLGHDVSTRLSYLEKVSESALIAASFNASAAVGLNEVAKRCAADVPRDVPVAESNAYEMARAFKEYRDSVARKYAARTGPLLFQRQVPGAATRNQSKGGRP